ncbi:MAG: hypothetical protein HQL46_06585 [Gammaproteobacteria bacterium]|nr:hypothetical protein [Gammaproteobacteria bacterium]
MKIMIFFIAILFAISFFLRINLPTNEDLDMHISQQQQSADPALNFIGKAMSKILYSDVVADWQFIDYIIFKEACSENLKVKMVAYPLHKWQLLEDNINRCDDFSFMK